MKRAVLALVLLMLITGSVYAVTDGKSWVTLVLERLFFLTPQQQTILETVSTPIQFVSQVEEKLACGLDKDVVVEEKATAVLLKNGTLDVKPIEGKVKVRNKSGKDRLWDVLVRLGNTERTDITNPYLTIDEILPGKTEETYYTSEMPTFPVTYLEEYDTFSTDQDLQKYFIYGKLQPVSISIEIGSNSDKALDVEYTRTVPNLGKVSVRGADYNENKSTLSWKGRVHPGQTVRIKIEGELTAASIENITLGTAKMELTSDDKLLTGAEIEKVAAYAPNNWYHKEYQDEKDRDLWHIEMRFKDISDFQTSIEKIRVYDAITEDTIKSISNMYLVLSPGQVWEEKLTYRASHFPVFRYELDYTAKLDYGTCSVSTLESEPLDFEVASMKMKKTLENADLDIDKKQKVEVRLEVINDGTAPIAELFVEDRVCSGFVTTDIKAYLIDNLGKNDITSDIEFTAQGSKINFRLPDFIEATGRELQPLDKVVFEYKLDPINPAPGECRTEAVGYANTNPPGPEIKLSSVTPISIIEGLHGVSIERVQVSKNSIRIRVENVGKSPTPPVELRAYLPESFSLESSSRDYLLDGRYIVWVLGEIDVGQTMAVYYSIDGEGDYMGEAQEPFLVVAEEVE